MPGRFESSPAAYMLSKNNPLRGRLAPFLDVFLYAAAQVDDGLQVANSSGRLLGVNRAREFDSRVVDKADDRITEPYERAFHLRIIDLEWVLPTLVAAPGIFRHQVKLEPVGAFVYLGDFIRQMFIVDLLAC